eukprot:TRINITY_DN6793_c0_g1_i12.p3 TRINITY_DN6793_c0_g1~~TRINITY_DN6793_c0_g1_i12.p3  ORF type:complete len:116 (+),score=10.71 TRINITY_DN6793_c0_g1_i12:1621-1968(+)
MIDLRQLFVNLWGVASPKVNAWLQEQDLHGARLWVRGLIPHSLAHLLGNEAKHIVQSRNTGLPDLLEVVMGDDSLVADTVSISRIAANPWYNKTVRPPDTLVVRPPKRRKKKKTW